MRILDINEENVISFKIKEVRSVMCDCLILGINAYSEWNVLAENFAQFFFQKLKNHYKY